MPRKTNSPPTTTKIPTSVSPMKLSPSAQAIYDDVSGQWQLTAPVRALLLLACQHLTRAEQCDAVVDSETLVIDDQKGSRKAHPLALLSRDLKNSAQNCLQRLLSNIEG